MLDRRRRLATAANNSRLLSERTILTRSRTARSAGSHSRCGRSMRKRTRLHAAVCSVCEASRQRLSHLHRQRTTSAVSSARWRMHLSGLLQEAAYPKRSIRSTLSATASAPYLRHPPLIAQRTLPPLRFSLRLAKRPFRHPAQLSSLPRTTAEPPQSPPSLPLLLLLQPHPPTNPKTRSTTSSTRSSHPPRSQYPHLRSRLSRRRLGKTSQPRLFFHLHLLSLSVRRRQNRRRLE